MPAPTYQTLLDLQDIDLHLIQLRHRHATHPARHELAMAEADVARLEADVGEIDERRKALDRDLKRLSDEVELLEDRRRSTDGKLYDGTITASKELLALQDEAAALLERQRRIEDDELELMEQLETVGDELETARTALEEARAAVATVTATLTGAMAEIEAEMAEAEDRRSSVAAQTTPELLTHYDQLVVDLGGVAVARFVDGRCEGCHMQLSAMAVDRLHKAADDAVVTCEECGRLLVR